MTRLTKRYCFSASHRLFTQQFSEERNLEIFGKCANPHGHGHNYYLEVSLSGDPDSRSSMNLSRKDFDQWVHHSVIERVDHTHLNTDIEAFSQLVPTAENILATIEQWLRDDWEKQFPGRTLNLDALRLEETPRNSFQINMKDKTTTA